MTRFGICYTHEELVLGGQIKDQVKRPISEGEAKNSGEECSLKIILLSSIWRILQPRFLYGLADEFSIAHAIFDEISR